MANARFQADFDSIVNNTEELGEIAFYQPDWEDGEDEPQPFEVNAIFDRRNVDDLESEGRIVVDTAICYVNLPIQPQKYDTITAQDGDVYKVISWTTTPNYVKLVLSKDAKLSHTHTSRRLR